MPNPMLLFLNHKQNTFKESALNYALDWFNCTKINQVRFVVNYIKKKDIN
jgi:hypothetical protein